jgi:leucyl-tRNA synthetase
MIITRRSMMAVQHDVDVYHPWEMEARWRQRWADEGTYRTPKPGADRATYYCLDFFPYPSGAGLSVGHGRNYVPSDVVARYRRMRGDAVLHPMGWDAFGLPAENEAMKQGVHPAESTARYARRYREQLDLLGCSYDWEREISSADPDYYRWNQAFFLWLYRRGLAYRAAAPVNWCDHCQTVLAAEEIEHGTCWRCHQPVTRRTIRQWYIRVTAYAEELASGLDGLDWPEHVLAMQRHWIGRREGVEIDLPAVETGEAITVFTSRLDTLFGVTFIVLAPEHPLVASLARPDRAAEVQAYVRAASERSDLERHTREPDGVFTGAHVITPDGRRVPVYVADYILADYGTGAVMGVPAHDTRDDAFAQRYDLPVRTVVVPRSGASASLPYPEPGMVVNSGRFAGMPSDEAAAAILAWLEAEGHARSSVHYRLRDWLISRQRYWGTPIPIVTCEACGDVPLPESALPVRLPALPDYRPRGDGRSPLANVPSFVETTCPRCGGPARRETDTMTGFVCSSWYYLRFTDPHNRGAPFDPEPAARWMPVDIYIGGAEHAVGHLMFSRFWTKFLADEGLIDVREPFPVLRSQGVLHARDPETGDVERMSKSKGNVVTPDSVIERYGADVTRLHLLFMGPFEANTVWEVEEDGVSPRHIEGVRRFLQRVWQLCESPDPERPASADTLRKVEAVDEQTTRTMHRTIKEVTDQMEVMHFNKAISALMTMVNDLEAHHQRASDTDGLMAARSVLLRLLAPLAPFVTEELWERIGARDRHGSIHHAPWPTWDPAWLHEEAVELAVQVNGRVRDHITVKTGAEEAVVSEMALAAAGAQRALDGRPVRKVIVVPDRLVNIVA